MTQLAQTFNLMSGSTKTDIVDIIVLADDKANSVQDARLILSDITAALTVRLPQKPFQKLNLKIIRH